MRPRAIKHTHEARALQTKGLLFTSLASLQTKTWGLYLLRVEGCEGGQWLRNVSLLQSTNHEHVTNSCCSYSLTSQNINSVLLLSGFKRKIVCTLFWPLQHFNLESQWQVDFSSDSHNKSKTMMIMCALKANYINIMVGKSLCVYKHCLMVGGNDSSRRTFHLNSETHLLSESETEKWPEMTLVLTFYFHSWCHPLNHFLSYFGLFIQVFKLLYFMMHSIHEQILFVVKKRKTFFIS